MSSRSTQAEAAKGFITFLLQHDHDGCVEGQGLGSHIILIFSAGCGTAQWRDAAPPPNVHYQGISAAYCLSRSV